MSAKVTVLLGPAGAGKTETLLSRYLGLLSNQSETGFGRQLWIAPTPRAATLVRETLVARHRGACLAPGVTTFADLARNVIVAAKLPIRILSPLLQRELLHRTVSRCREDGLLSHYAAAARHAGFVDLLAAHIRELRQRNIEPTAYERLAGHGLAPSHGELAALYREYDRQLTAHCLVDVAGTLRLAGDVLAAGGVNGFERFELVVVDGFGDFTVSERAFLHRLAERTQALMFSLPIDDTAVAPRDVAAAAELRSLAVRNDLFAKSAATRADLKRSFPGLQEQVIPSRPARNAALGYIVAEVFRYPHAAPSASVLAALSSLEIVAAASVHDEVVQLARRIKRLLVPTSLAIADASAASARGSASGRPTRPEDVVVVVRSVAEIAPRLEEVFSRFGIPYAIESNRRIASSAVFRTLTNLLRLAVDDWPFRRIVSVITNTTFSLIDDSARQAADWLVRDLQRSSGRNGLVEHVAALAAKEGQTHDLGDHQQRRVGAAVLALPVLTRVAAALDHLPREASANEWLAALAAVGSALGFPPFDNATAGPLGTPPADQVAWDALRAHLIEFARLDTWLAAPPRQLDRRQFLALLVDIGAKQPLPRQHGEVGRVRILSAQSARAVSARHLFLAGMSEQAFPAGVPAGALVSDSDYRFLSRAVDQQDAPHKRFRANNRPNEDAVASDAIPVDSTRSQDEMLLFYEVLSRAQESLTISYPAMDDKAQDLPPSPYVVELQRMFAQQEQHIHCAPPELSPVPNRNAIGNLADWRVAATANAAQTGGDLGLLAGLMSSDATRPLGHAIDSGIRCVHARARGETFGPFEGVLTSSAVAARLGQRFGAKHRWSPSQLESYATCPFRFFLENVLGLEPLGDLVLETDFARRGNLLHQVLAAFHRKFSGSADAWSAFRHDEARFTAELQQAIGATFTGLPDEGVAAALWELDRRQIEKWTSGYHSQLDTYYGLWDKLDEPLRPAHLELRFGRQHAGEEGYEDPNSVDDSFRLDIGGETIHLTGRIDRIDVGRAAGRTVFNVIDYKSGHRPTLTRQMMESGERLQPPLYVMAAQALVFGRDEAAPLWAGYWSLRTGVSARTSSSQFWDIASAKPTENWNELQPIVKARVGEIVRAARRGDFPVASTDVDCTRVCQFRTVCRIAQARKVGKVHVTGEPQHVH